MANFENQTQNQLPIEKKSKIDSPDNLSEDIIENIFTFLPIKKAIVIASTVSPRYKRSWRFNRRFLFGGDFCLRYSQHELAAMVDHSFNSHEGDEIKTFKLFIDPVGIEDLLNRWLQICTQKDLEDLELLLCRPGFTIEFSIFNTLHKLKTLELCNCVIQLPEVPSGLRFLRMLRLDKIHITEDMFDVFIEHCKILEIVDLINCSIIKKLNLITRENNHFKKLRISRCQDLEEIVIDSPTLRSISYHGKFLIVRIFQRMQLYEAFFYFITSNNYMQSTQLETLVKDLSHVSILTTTPLLIEGMAARIHDKVFREAQYCFMNMRELQLFMDGGMFCNPYDITMFLKNCPSLMKLFIDLNDFQFDLGMYWEMHQKHLLDNCSHKFTQLKVVVLRSFKFLSSELELVKIILQRATNLETLIFVPPKIKGRCKFKREDALKYEKLFCSWRASTRAIIKLYENYVEKSSVNPTHLHYWI